MIRLTHNLEFPGAPDSSVQRQPAGFDLSLRELARFSGIGVLDFDNSRRALPETFILEWENDSILLQPGGYLATYNEEIAVPPDCAGIVLPRSSLMRCGAILHSALWDPGYRGRGQGLLTVHQPLRLYRDARIGQLILIRIESSSGELYTGQYQGENL